MNGILKGCSMILLKVSTAARISIPRRRKLLQLHENVEEVRAKSLVVKVFPKVLCNFNGLILRQLRGACNVQQKAAKLGEGRFFVSAAWGVIISTSLWATTVVATVVITAIICAKFVNTRFDPQRPTLKGTILAC